MSLRSGNRQRAAQFTRKQKQYRIESDSEEDDDDETEMDQSSNLRYGGGVLAILKNNTNGTRRQRRNGSEKGNGRGKNITSSPLQKSRKENFEAVADENNRTPPPRNVIMTRSAMRAISPLTTQKANQQRGRNKVSNNVSVEENSRADSFDDSVEDEDDETRPQTLSSEDNEKNCSTSRENEHDDEGEEEESYEDSYGPSESSSEFEFGVDDEEFIPDEEDEDDDESSPMSDFIVEDDSDDYISRGNTSNDASTRNNDEIDVVDGGNGDDDVQFCDDTVVNESAINESPYLSATNVPEDSIDDNTFDAEETPTKFELPKKNLSFSSPEPQMAMIVDENDEDEDEDDVLFATIIDSDTVDGDTVVLTFDEDEENDAEETESTGVHVSEQQSNRDNHISAGKTKEAVDDNQESRTQPSSLLANKNSQPIVFQEEEHEGHAKKNNEPEPSKDITLVAPETSKEVSTRKNDKHYRQEGTVKRNKWALGAKIGVGSFGEVHVGMNTQTGVLMAVKKFRMEGAVMKDIRTEVELMRSFKHVNIVRYLGAQMDKDFLHIFQEWVPGGSVASLLSKFGAFSIEVIKSYVSQTLNGLVYLHENNIMHRDIKGSNILVNDEGIVKLADFGASKKLKNLNADMMMSLTVRGTPYFMAPEVFEEKYSAKADVWGIGCVAIQMATAKPPWKELGFTNPISLFNYMTKQKGPPPMEHPQKESFSKQQEVSWTLFEQFVCRCFEYEPSKRPSAREVQDDQFFLTSIIGDADDDESMDCRGLFSPGNESKKFFSPKQFSSPAKQSSAARHLRPRKSDGRQEMTFLSPPLPKKNIERSKSPFAKCTTSRAEPKTENSPSLDTREWPAWAKTELEKQNNCKVIVAEAKETTQGNLTKLMDSLALSEDSSDTSQRTSNERRSSTFGSLIGIDFLDNSSA